MSHLLDINRINPTGKNINLSLFSIDFPRNLLKSVVLCNYYRMIGYSGLILVWFQVSRNIFEVRTLWLLNQNKVLIVSLLERKKKRWWGAGYWVELNRLTTHKFSLTSFKCKAQVEISWQNLISCGE